MTAPGNASLFLALTLGILMSGAYALGRIHQWHKHGLERDEAYRRGYDKASLAILGMITGQKPAGAAPAPAPAPASGSAPASDPDPGPGPGATVTSLAGRSRAHLTGRHMPGRARVAVDRPHPHRVARAE